MRAACLHQVLAYLSHVDYNEGMKDEKDESAMKRCLLIMVMLLACLLASCGTPAGTAEPTEPTIVETLAPTEPPVDVGGTLVEVDAVSLDLATITYDLEMLLTAAPQLESINRIDLGVTTLTFEQVERIRAAFPNAQVNYSLELLGHAADITTDCLDCSTMTLDQTQEVLAQLPLLTGLQQINFVAEDGACVFSVEDIPVLDQFRQALPEVDFRVSFELFGKTVTSEDERIEYYRVPIGNEGAETVRAVLPYLTACEYLLMDGCDVDNEVMDQLRTDFPKTKVVWRVWLVKPQYNSARVMRLASFLTDTHLVRTVAVTDKTSHVLKYCTETKYVDFGHNNQISDFSFLTYMPDLEVAILCLTNISDLTPLMSCPKLEYLEVFTSKVTDLSPLAACTNLEHLNISNLSKVKDISPLYGLTKLKRLRITKTTPVPASQIEEIKKLLPECDVMTAGWDPTENGWRKDDSGKLVPRYALLREQMEYDTDAKYGIK